MIRLVCLEVSICFPFSTSYGMMLHFASKSSLISIGLLLTSLFLFCITVHCSMSMFMSLSMFSSVILSTLNDSSLPLVACSGST